MVCVVNYTNIIITIVLFLCQLSLRGPEVQVVLFKKCGALEWRKWPLEKRLKMDR